MARAARGYAYGNYGFDSVIADVETFLAGYTAHDGGADTGRPGDQN